MCVNPLASRLLYCRHRTRPVKHRVISLLAVGTFCVSPETQAEEKLWTDNKITPAQPFPGKICAVATLWPGYNLLIEEIGGRRVCLARVWIGEPIRYSVLDPDKGETKEDPKCFEANKHWIYVLPGIDADRFSWSLGPWLIGRRFGDDDIVRQVTTPKREPTK